jgi:N-acetylglucosaminyldiphosphoundecaprenol N-acetyl-beta-D-mannosaminyltransferase
MVHSGMSNSIPSISFDDNDHNGASGVNVNLLNPAAVLVFIKNKIKSGSGFALATLNLDHVVKLASNTEFLKAYREHDAVCADGFPIVWLGRMAGKDIIRTAGSDLLLPVIELACEMGKSIAIVGTTETIIAAATEKLKQQFPLLNIAYTVSPPFGFDPLSHDAVNIMRHVEESGVSICLLAFGAPKQEILAAVGRRITKGVGFISIGASIDFIAGHQVRAPQWVQSINMEWLWRMLSNPRRLCMRYLQCAMVFPVLLFRALRNKV